MPFYLFEVEETSRYNSYYNFCRTARKEEADKIINVKFILPPPPQKIEFDQEIEESIQIPEYY